MSGTEFKQKKQTKNLLFNTVLPTTVVGSYPVVKGNRLKNLLDPYRGALSTAISDQIKAGIDIISDGQVRDNMIHSFTKKILGIEDQQVVDLIGSPEKPITVPDLSYACSYYPYVKGIITGPTTLSKGLLIRNEVYSSRSELSIDLARVLAKEASELEMAGACMLQIDEPMLTFKDSDFKTVCSALNIIVSSVSVPVSLHVCGKSCLIMDQLVKMPVDILDLELSDNKDNLTCLSKQEYCNKKIGFGCINTGNFEVESVEKIKKRIETGIDLFGAERLIIDPDCGFRLHPRESALLKLSNMVTATQQLREEYCSELIAS